METNNFMVHAQRSSAGIKPSQWGVIAEIMDASADARITTSEVSEITVSVVETFTQMAMWMFVLAMVGMITKSVFGSNPGSPDNPGKELLDWREAQVGDVVNIHTWMPRRAHLIRYKVVRKPDAPGYEGLIIEKPEGGSEMYIPGNTIKKIELSGSGNPIDKEWVVIVYEESYEVKKRVLAKVEPVARPAGVRLHSITGMAFFKFESVPTRELADEIARIAREEGVKRVEVSELTGPEETERDYE